MHHLLILKIAGTNVRHMTVHEEKGFGPAKLRMINEIKTGIFPNAIFQQAYVESDSKHIDELVMTSHDENEVWRVGFNEIKDLLNYSQQDIRNISNIGDWAGKPGAVNMPDGRTVYVTDVYKYIRMKDLYKESIRVMWLDAAEVLKQYETVQTHLMARDAFYDQAYVDTHGQRNFLRYSQRTDKSRESTLGENHHAAVSVIVDGLEYPTLDAVALAYNLPVATVTNRVDSAKDMWSEWQYKGREKSKAVTYILRHKSHPGFYFGSTSNPKKRLSSHIDALTRETHGTPKLKAMVAEYGVSGVTYEVLFEGTLAECQAKEQELVSKHWGEPNLLNASKDTKSAISHHTQDPEVEQRRLEGLRAAVTTDEHRQKMSESMKSTWSVPGRKEARSGAGNPFAKCVSIHGVVYGSVIDAVRAKAGGLSDWVIRTRLKAGSDPALFYCDAEGNKLS